MSPDSDDLAARFGTHIRDAAKHAGYDLEGPRTGGMTQLAKDAGMSQATASRMLAGQVIPDAKSLEALAAALGIPVLDLLARAGVISDEAAAANPRPQPLTDKRALTHLGVTDPADQTAILAIISRLKGRAAK